jgi:hypothetical protein
LFPASTAAIAFSLGPISKSSLRFVSILSPYIKPITSN